MNPTEYTGPQDYTEDAPVLAWHLGRVAPGNTEDAPAIELNYPPFEIIHPGDTVYDECVAMCIKGPHACLRAIDCARYGHGPMLSRVALWGFIDGDPEDKLVAQHRKHLTIADLRPQLWELGKTSLAREIARNPLPDNATPTERALRTVLDAFIQDRDTHKQRAESALAAVNNSGLSERHGTSTRLLSRALSSSAPSRAEINEISSLTPEDAETMFRQAVGEVT